VGVRIEYQYCAAHWSCSVYGEGQKNSIFRQPQWRVFFPPSALLTPELLVTAAEPLLDILQLKVERSQSLIDSRLVNAINK